MRFKFSTVRAAALAAASVIALTQYGVLTPARGEEPSDLRGIRIGMALKDLPDTGFANFACAADPTHKLSGWEGWKDCPAEKDGTHAVRFDYDRATSREGTMVAGHPAILTLMIDDHASVNGLRIETDPKARLYIRKKAFLLGRQAKSRYGSNEWDCTDAQPGAGEESIGGVYVNERCTKVASGRFIVIERRLFRRPDQDMKSFVDETRITIERAKS